MSRIVLGLMHISNLTIDEIEKLIIDSLNNGITMFDLADIYGNGLCEELVGVVIKRKPELRKKMYIQSKVGICKNPKRYNLSKNYIIQACKDCLKRLNIDYLDCLMLHRPDIFMDNKEIAEAISYLQHNNLIKDFAVSNFSSSQIKYLQDELQTPIKYNQVHLGIGNTTMIDQTMYTNIPSKYVSKESDDLFFFLKHEKIVIQCWSPFQMNWFEGSIFDEEKFPEINLVINKYAIKYQCSKCALATAFLLKLNNDLLVVTGSTNIEHIKEAIEGEKIKLSREDWYSLYNELGHRIP